MKNCKLCTIEFEKKNPETEKEDTKTEVWNEVMKTFKWCPETEQDAVVASIKDLVKARD
jgi:hypothetical protein